MRVSGTPVSLQSQQKTRQNVAPKRGVPSEAASEAPMFSLLVTLGCLGGALAPQGWPRTPQGRQKLPKVATLAPRLPPHLVPRALAPHFEASSAHFVAKRTSLRPSKRCSRVHGSLFFTFLALRSQATETIRRCVQNLSISVVTWIVTWIITLALHPFLLSTGVMT